MRLLCGCLGQCRVRSPLSECKTGIYKNRLAFWFPPPTFSLSHYHVCAHANYYPHCQYIHVHRLGQSEVGGALSFDRQQGQRGKCKEGGEEASQAGEGGGGGVSMPGA